MDKQLAIRMEKVYDFPDGEAEKYAILAYFKEQERVKNDLLNAAVNSQMLAAENITLSQQVAMGLTDKELEAYKQTLISNKYGGEDTNINVNQDSQETHQTISNATISMNGKLRNFTITDFILCIIAFLLFLLLITR